MCNLLHLKSFDVDLPSSLLFRSTSNMAATHSLKDEQYNWRNFLICFLVSLGQIAFGYPASIIGVTCVVSFPHKHTCSHPCSTPLADWANRPS